MITDCTKTIPPEVCQQEEEIYTSSTEVKTPSGDMVTFTSTIQNGELVTVSSTTSTIQNVNALTKINVIGTSVLTALTQGSLCFAATKGLPYQWSAGDLYAHSLIARDYIAPLTGVLFTCGSFEVISLISDTWADRKMSVAKKISTLTNALCFFTLSGLTLYQSKIMY